MQRPPLLGTERILRRFLRFHMILQALVKIRLGRTSRTGLAPNVQLGNQKRCLHQVPEASVWHLPPPGVAEPDAQCGTKAGSPFRAIREGIAIGACSSCIEYRQGSCGGWLNGASRCSLAANLVRSRKSACTPSCHIRLAQASGYVWLLWPLKGRVKGSAPCTKQGIYSLSST